MIRYVTQYDPPPIPTREFDWSATYADYDLGSPIGYGPSRDAAIADLMAQTEFVLDQLVVPRADPRHVARIVRVGRTYKVQFIDTGIFDWIKEENLEAYDDYHND